MGSSIGLLTHTRCWLTPAAGVSAPAPWIRPAADLINLGSLLANGDGRCAVSLNGCHEFDPAVPVPVVLPVDERGNQVTGLLFGGKGLARVVRPVFHGPEQPFGVGGVVADTWPLEQPQDPQLLQTAFQRGGTHGVAVVGIEHQGVLSAFTDSLFQGSPSHQIGRNRRMLTLLDIPGHHLSTPDVDHQAEVQPDPTHRGEQIGDVPAPHRDRTCGPQPRNRSGSCGSLARPRRCNCSWSRSSR